MAASLIWFNQNLRLHDNEVLHIAADIQQPLICWYCIDSAWFKSDRYGLRSMGEHRWRFLKTSLDIFAQQLQSVGQKLYITYGDPVVKLAEVIDTYDVNCVISQHQANSDAQQQWLQVQQQYPELSYHRPHNFTLFKPDQLPQSDNFPASFTQFRKQVEAFDVPALSACPAQLPPPLPLRLEASLLQQGPDVDNESPVIFSGGELAGLSQVETYFSGVAASSYKKTRNALMGWSTSTKFSPWLASGTLSVRYLLQALKQFESQHQPNESTYWIYFELLWREYFQWYAEHFQHRLFDFKGISKTKPLTAFYPQRFKQWVNGSTPWPIVNACMNELKHTGYLSNRGRQLVASCLVNELSLDWRCGAAYFEQQLLDYDPASNWGNWQYIAGVGPDPRGGRHFNLVEQTKTHDPEGHYCQQWLDNSVAMPSSDTFDRVDHVDMVDWPITPSS
ncbi:MAG: deoxyribodipyrimidine photo-lyase [Paraglaciecola psychrophila]|jgi:deoxyribodipyrimidine photo-lyase